MDFGHDFADQLSGGKMHPLAYRDQQTVCAVVIVFGGFDFEETIGKEHQEIVC